MTRKQMFALVAALALSITLTCSFVAVGAQDGTAASPKADEGALQAPPPPDKDGGARPAPPPGADECDGQPPQPGQGRPTSGIAGRPGGHMPGGPMAGGPGGRMMPPPDFEKMGGFIGVVDKLGEACFNPRMAGMIAAGALKDEFRRKPEEVTKDLETQLAKTKTLGLRNALRILLKDLYKAQGQEEKALAHLRTMLEENDAALQQAPAQAK